MKKSLKTLFFCLVAALPHHLHSFYIYNNSSSEKKVKILSYAQFGQKNEFGMMIYGPIQEDILRPAQPIARRQLHFVHFDAPGNNKQIAEKITFWFSWDKEKNKENELRYGGMQRQKIDLNFMPKPLDVLIIDDAKNGDGITLRKITLAELKALQQQLIRILQEIKEAPAKVMPKLNVHVRKLPTTLVPTLPKTNGNSNGNGNGHERTIPLTPHPPASRRSSEEELEFSSEHLPLLPHQEAVIDQQSKKDTRGIRTRKMIDAQKETEDIPIGPQEE